MTGFTNYNERAMALRHQKATSLPVKRFRAQFGIMAQSLDYVLYLIMISTDPYSKWTAGLNTSDKVYG
jgi:hypothetical protein